VHLFLVEHPATAVAIARVSRPLYEFFIPVLYRSCVGPLKLGPEKIIKVDFTTLKQSDQALVQRLFLAQSILDTDGLDRLINLVELSAIYARPLYHSWCWARRIVRVTFRSRIDYVAVTLRKDIGSSGAILPNLTHLTTFAAPTRCSHKMHYIVAQLLGASEIAYTLGSGT